MNKYTLNSSLKPETCLDRITPVKSSNKIKLIVSLLKGNHLKEPLKVSLLKGNHFET